MAKVYFRPIDSYRRTSDIAAAVPVLLERLVADEAIVLASRVPLKVHFGERGNQTFIAPANFAGLIEWLRGQGIDSCFIETGAVYSGSRMRAADHRALAAEHGFTALPVVIADGERGEAFAEVTIDQKHFKTCKIARGFVDLPQMIVLSHFKGHTLAGFGGALKHLAMGCASRGGKLAQHIDARPFIIPFVCRRCGACVRQCPVDAIRIDGMLPKISHRRCIGCAACLAVCPHRAILVNVFKINLASTFQEKMAEYALAAHRQTRALHVTFAFNLTGNCDCIGKPMTPIARDLGVLASSDPVAIDQACHDLVDRQEGRAVFGGRHILAYAEAIGLGSRRYDLVTV